MPTMEHALATGLVGLLAMVMPPAAPAAAAPPPPPPPAAPAAIGAAPVAAALPGALGGGILAIGTSLVVLEAVSLAPPGTTPVSAFPPYITPRRL